MDTALFDYPFPKELVAQHPLPSRQESRMMVLPRQTGAWEHRRFYEIPSLLQAGDLLVTNDALADPVDFQGQRVPPLPPYIKRAKAADFTEEDFQRYRTIYAKAPGSRAAPTAGFHFSEEMFQKLRAASVEIRELTLHISYDTYKPIRSARIEEHPMHGEIYEIPMETAAAVQLAKQEGRRVIAVGTTVVRALESWAIHNAPSHDSPLPPQSPSYIKRGIPSHPSLNIREGPGVSYKRIEGSTNLFICPDFHFQIVDALLTNFHRPRSTVLVMVSAFAGRDLILAAYEEAIRERYRLFSYGDCMLIL